MAKFWDSVGDLFGNVLKGAMKSLEGIYDFHAGTVGLVGGWFDDEFEKDVREHITYDWTGNNTKFLNGVEKDSVFGDTARNIAGGVGGMLPSVALSFIPYAGPALSAGALMMGAAGNSMESSLNEGAGYGNAFMYGVGKGVVEGATEKLGGYVLGGGTSKVGKAIAGTKFGNAVSKGVGKVAFDAVSEGAEEVISDLSDPALKYVTGVDDNIGENYAEAVKGLPKTFVEGATVGSIMQGGTTAITNIANSAKGRGGAKATRADNAMQNILEVTKNYTGVRNTDFKYDNAVKFNLETVSSELVKMSAEARKNYLDSIGVYKNAFDRETGRLKENNMPYAHREAITANLRMFSGNLSHKPLKGTESITNGAKTAKKTVERVVGSCAAVVVTNELGAEDRAIYNPDDGVIYINNNADLTEKDVAKAVALHEVTHTTEGTKAYKKLVEQIEAIANDKNAPESVKKIVGDITLRQYSTATSYEAEMEGLTPMQSKYLVDTEVNADLIGDLLSDDYFIEKLAERDMGLLQKLYNSFKNRANAKKSELGPEGIKYLKKLASKFGTAIEKRAGGVKISQIGDEDEEKEEKTQDVGGVSNVNERKLKGKSTNSDSIFQTEFENTVDAILGNNYNSHNIVLIGRTPSVLTDIGLSQLPLSITANHIYSIAKTEQEARQEGKYRQNSNYHGLGAQAVKQLKEKLSEPIMVLAHQEFTASQQAQHVQNKKIVVLVDLQVDGRQVICPIEIDTEVRKGSDRYDVNLVDTYFDKGNVRDLIKEAIAKENIGEVGFYYINKKKASNLLQGSGYQLPQQLASRLSASNVIIRKIDTNVNRKISDFTQSQQFKRFFGDWQNKPQSASKIVNDDGTPRIVYHQTDADITTFDTSVEGAGARDNTLPHGIYMKPTPFDIGLKGKKQMKLYASIKTPLVFDTRETAQRYWKKNIPGYDAILDEIAENDAKYNEEFENTFDATSEDDSAAEAILAEWEEKNTVLDKNAKLLIDTYLKNSRFDGIILEKDVGSMGRTVTTYIALKPEQVKSATDNIGTFDRDDPDIRYSRKRTYDPKNGKEPTFEAVPGGVKVNFNDFDTNKSNDNSNDFEAAERARRESLDALLKDGGTTFVGLTNADLDEYVATGKTLHTRNKKQRMLENGKSPILTTESEIAEFVTKAIHGEALGEVRAFGKVDERLAQAISNVRTSLNLEGKYLEIQADAIREAYKVHSAPKEKGDIALTEEDFKNIHRHIFDFDGVLSVDTHNGKTEIHMYKKSEGGYYHILTVVSSERSSLQVTKLIGVSKEKFESKYAKKIERSTGSLRMQEASDPSTKAQHTASVLSNNSIHKSGEKSNSSDKKTQKNHYNSKTKVRELIEGAIATLDLTDEEGKAFAFVTKDAEGDVVTTFWKAINSASGGTRRKLMDNLADVLLANTVFAEKSKYEALDYLKSVMHKFDLREIQEQIEPSLKQKINARWGFKAVGSEDAALDMRSVITALNKMGLNISYADPVQALIEINNFYDSVREYAELEKGDRLSKRLGEEDYKAKKKELVSELTRIFEENKTENELAGRLAFVIEKSQEENKKHREYKKEFKQDEKRTRAIGVTVYLLNKFKNIKNHKYDSATQPHFDEFMGIVKTISKMEYRGNINQSSVRELMAQVKEWYGKDNPLLNYVNEEHKGLYCEQIAEAIDYFVKGEHAEQEFSYSELRAFNDILSHLSNLIENHNKIFRGGKYVEASDVASAQYNVALEAEKNHSSFERVFLHNKYIRFFMDPMSVLAVWDGHDPNGYFTTTYREFAEALINQRYDEMRALAEFDEFRQKHKKYFKTLVNGKDTIKIGGRIDPRNLTIGEIEMPKNVALDLYMVSKTGRAIETLEETGYKVRFDGKHEEDTMSTITRAQIEEMYNKFSEEDKELISIMERAYNGICRELKYDTDMKRLGFSNVFEGYYYPINRINATDFDTNDFFAMMERVSASSFNKSRVHSKNAIIVSNALTKFMRHVNGVTRYANLAIPVENMQRVFNLDVGGDKHMPTSIKAKLKDNALWTGAEDYMQRLVSDAQNVGLNLDGGSKAIAWLRGSYAKFQLGANPKVWFSQLSSYLAAYGELRASSLAKAVAIDGSDVDKYCRLAAVRHYDKAVTKAQAVTDRAGNVLTAPIEAVDRGVIRKLFAACQAEAQARYKLEIGTEENKIKAGEILTEVILKTQQNQLVTEQSGAMRSTSEIIKSFTMFSADSMKLLSRFLGSMGEIATLNKRIKAAESKGDSALVERLKAQRGQAVKHLLKYGASIALVSMWMAALVKFFKHIYNKDDEEETVGEWLFLETGKNILGMAPLVRDVTSFFADGYETDVFVTSMANDVLKTFSKTKDLFVDWTNGKPVSQDELLANVKSVFFSIGQVFGIPTRNVYNFLTGMLRRFDEGTGKSIDAWFKEPSESDAKASLREGISDGDVSLTEYGLNQMYKKYGLELADNALKREMDRLVKMDASGALPNNEYTGEKVNLSPLGFKIPENLEINGEDVELSAEDRKVFKNGLKSAEKANATMVKTYYYRQLNDKYKAYAMRKVFEYYDLVSRYEVAGATDGRGRPSLQYYGEAVGIDVLAVLMAYKQQLNAVSDEEKARRGKSTKELIVEYLKRFNLTPVQKSLVLRALGYSDKDNDKLVKAFIERRPGLSREQRAEFTQIAKCDL